MRILRNYVLHELMQPLLVSVLTLTGIFLLGNIVKIADLVLNRGINPFQLATFLGLMIPEMLTYSLPTSLLASILLVFGGMAQNNEIIAFRSHGINPLRVMLPIMILGLMCSIFVMILSDQIVPRYSFAARKVVKRMFVQDPFACLKPGVPMKVSDEFVFLAREVNDNELRNVTVYQTQEDKPTRTIIAERCDVMREKEKSKITIRLYNGTIDEPDTEDSKVFNKLDFKVYELPLVDLENIERIGKKTKEFSIDELITKRHDPTLSKEKNREYLIEIHKKISFAFGSFLFALVGLPIAIITRRGNMLVSFALALIVLTVYYVLYSWVQALAIHGILPSYVALWIPFVAFLATGIYLSRKILQS